MKVPWCTTTSGCRSVRWAGQRCDGTTDEEQFYGTLALGEVCSGVGAWPRVVVCSATTGVLFVRLILMALK